MKKKLITVLRDKNTDIKEFRNAAEKLALILAGELAGYLEKERLNVGTPIGKAIGSKIKNDIVFIPILRSALALLFPFLKFFEHAKVGFIGLRRDEQTAIAYKYYDNLPKIKPSDDIVILDPMIATGGSGCAALKILKEKGILEEKIIFVAIISATPGIEEIEKKFPNVKIICVQEDKELNKDQFIVPGLGDFGDRFFGTLPE